MTKHDQLLTERNRHVPQGPLNVHPVFVSQAKGAVITDVEGKRYVDFAGTT